MECLDLGWKLSSIKCINIFEIFLQQNDMKQLFGPYCDSSVTQNTVNAILLVKNLFALNWYLVNFNLNAKQQILKQCHIVY